MSEFFSNGLKWESGFGLGKWLVFGNGAGDPPYLCIKSGVERSYRKETWDIPVRAFWKYRLSELVFDLEALTYLAFVS
jgi:hypothetical protein